MRSLERSVLHFKVRKLFQLRVELSHLLLMHE